jgi:isoleucyl-tRNA synthetase
LSDAYRKFRNTFKAGLGNLSDFDPERDSLAPADMLEIDRWILLRTEDLVAKCRAWYSEFAFHKVYRAVYDFITAELSAVYIDASKDRLYTAAPKAARRRSAQTAFYRVTYALVRLVAPLLAFTTEEVWGYLPKPSGAPESVHLALFPEPDELTAGFSAEQRKRIGDWEKLIAVRDEVNKALEAARQSKFIGKSLEARVRLKAGSELFQLLDKYRSDLPELFISSEVALDSGSDALSVEIERAAGDKCERCWKYTAEVGKSSEFPTLCDACQEAVREMLGN